jgi:hypothetical protein
MATTRVGKVLLLAASGSSVSRTVSRSSRRVSCGHHPIDPVRSTVPASASSAPTSICMSLDFPLPFSPTMPTISPFRSATLAPVRTSTGRRQGASATRPASRYRLRGRRRRRRRARRATLSTATRLLYSVYTDHSVQNDLFCLSARRACVSRRPWGPGGRQRSAARGRSTSTRVRQRRHRALRGRLRPEPEVGTALRTPVLR